MWQTQSSISSFSLQSWLLKSLILSLWACETIEICVGFLVTRYRHLPGWSLDSHPPSLCPRIGKFLQRKRSCNMSVYLSMVLLSPACWLLKSWSLQQFSNGFKLFLSYFELFLLFSNLMLLLLNIAYIQRKKCSCILTVQGTVENPINLYQRRTSLNPYWISSFSSNLCALSPVLSHAGSAPSSLQSVREHCL